MNGKSVSVWVFAVAVLVGVVCGALGSHAAERQPSRTSARQGEGTFGIVTAKTDKEITIKAEGEHDAKRYLLAPQGGAPKADLQAALKIVFPTNLVVFQAQGDQDSVLTGIQAIHSKTRVGTATGTVVAVDADPKWPTFDLKPSGKGHTEHYVARWDMAAKSVDKKLAQIIAGLNVGDKLKVGWFYDERSAPRISRLLPRRSPSVLKARQRPLRRLDRQPLVAIPQEQLR